VEEGDNYSDELAHVARQSVNEVIDLYHSTKSDIMKGITILRKKAKLGEQGFPRATLAFYGPDDKKATKAVLGIFLREGDEGTIHRYFSEDQDARFKIDIQQSILARLKEHNVRSLIMVEKIFGCPHEEGIDYPEGKPCPRCPFWNGRDRYAALE
jgi:hypothetical protein